MSSSHIQSFICVQEEVVKLTEKSLNSKGNSPVLNQLKAPDELKSNILKAQAEAALKVFSQEVLVFMCSINILAYSRKVGCSSFSSGWEGVFDFTCKYMVTTSAWYYIC